MSNTLTNLYNTNISNKILKYLVPALAPFQMFSTDFSADTVEQGNAVDVNLMAAPGTASDLQTDHSGQRSAAAKDHTNTKTTVTMDQQPIDGFHFSDEEMALIKTGLMTTLQENKIKQSVYAVVNTMWKYVMNLVTAANFSGVETIPVATANLDDIVALNATLAAAGFPVDQDDAISMMLKSTLFAAFKQDGAVQDLSASGLNVVQTGSLKKLDIFPLFQSATLPPAGGTPADENLTGFAATKDAIAIAGRIVVPQDEDRLKDFNVIQDPITGLALVHRAWYDPDYGKLYNTIEAKFGASKGNGSALYRIRESA